MKRLVLIRHAKAVPWGYDDDFNRELTERGESDSVKVAGYLNKIGVYPDQIITSPAVRASQTALIFAGTMNYPENSMVKNPDLYHGMTTGELIELLRNLNDGNSCVFLFGHNPSFEYYAGGLCRNFSSAMPTCSAVVIDFTGDRWENVSARSGSLFQQINPKELAD